MLASLENAFNTLIHLQGRTVTLEDLDTAVSAQVTAASSNYFRNMNGPEEMVVEGKEFVFSVRELESVSAPTLKRGVRITDAGMGEETITYVKPMITMGKIIGYRVRTG